MAARILRSPTIAPLGRGQSGLPDHVRDALEDAYRQGVEDGRAAAGGDVARHAAALADKLAAGEQRLVDAVRAAATLDAERIVDLAICLAEWFVGSAPVGDPQIVRAAVDTLLEETRPGDVHQLAVHPDVAAVIAGHLPAEVSGVVADPTLGPSELRLSTDGLVIERRWRQAIERVRAGLVNDLAASMDDTATIAPAPTPHPTPTPPVAAEHPELDRVDPAAGDGT